MTRREERAAERMAQIREIEERRNEIAKKVAALLAESEAALTEVDKIFECTKKYLIVAIHHSDS